MNGPRLALTLWFVALSFLSLAGCETIITPTPTPVPPQPTATATLPPAPPVKSLLKDPLPSAEEILPSLGPRVVKAGQERFPETKVVEARLASVIVSNTIVNHYRLEGEDPTVAYMRVMLMQYAGIRRLDGAAKVLSLLQLVHRKTGSYENVSEAYLVSFEKGDDLLAVLDLVFPLKYEEKRKGGFQIEATSLGQVPEFLLEVLPIGFWWNISVPLAVRSSYCAGAQVDNVGIGRLSGSIVEPISVDELEIRLVGRSGFVSLDSAVESWAESGHSVEVLWSTSGIRLKWVSALFYPKSFISSLWFEVTCR